MGRRCIVTCAVLFSCICGSAQAQLVYSGDGRLYEIGADGSDRSLFANPTSPRSFDAQPEWSPDGTQLAIVHERDNWSRIHILSRDGSTRRRITPADGFVYVGTPRWSPDGDRLAFARYRESAERYTTEIVVRDVDDGEEITLVRQRLDRRFTSVGTPEWSPDGTTVLYGVFRIDRNAYYHSSIHSAPLDGGATSMFMREAHSPVFSPDGSRIAFVSIADRNGETCGSDECSYNGELYVMAADGENATRLTRSEGDDGAAAWAPDGSRITFNSNRNFPEGYQHELYSIEPDGDCLTWLTNGTVSSFTPAWRPDAANTDPGGCGATPRPPLIEVDLTLLREFGPTRPLWLGLEHRGLLLSEVDPLGGLYLGYSDCGRYHPRDCPPGTQLILSSVCSRGSTIEFLAGNVYRRRGAMVQDFFGAEAGLVVFTGGIEVHIPEGQPRRALQALRPFPRETAVDRLRPPTIPASLRRQIGRAVRLHERLGSVAAVAERMKLRREAVRERLWNARALEKFGHPVRTTRC